MAICELHAELVKRVEKCELAIDKLNNQDNKLSIQQARMDEKLDNISMMLTELKAEIGKLSERPTKRYDDLVKACIGGIITLLGGIALYFATKPH